MQLVSPMPGSVASARTYLGNAQAQAANISNEPTVKTMDRLLDGVTNAKRAAAELFMATPVSDFQDLVAARSHVLDGQKLLEQGVSALQVPSGVDPTFHVQVVAKLAFDEFEAAFEILDND